MDESEPAFPQHANTGNMESWKHGMTLRDYFAGQALAAMRLGLLTSEIVIAGYAERAYQFADAMLKQRSQSRET